MAATTKGTTVKRSKPIIKRETLVAWLFLLPSLIGFITFYAVPSVRGLLISFTDWNLLSDPEPIGLENYRRLASDI